MTGVDDESGEWPVSEDMVSAMDGAWNGGRFREAAAEIYRAGREADPLVAAERALVAAALRWGTVTTGPEYRDVCDYLRSHVITVLRLRESNG
jgi:hypothetical protein